MVRRTYCMYFAPIDTRRCVNGLTHGRHLIGVWLGKLRRPRIVPLRPAGTVVGPKFSYPSSLSRSLYPQTRTKFGHGEVNARFAAGMCWQKPSTLYSRSRSHFPAPWVAGLWWVVGSERVNVLDVAELRLQTSEIQPAASRWGIKLGQTGDSLAKWAAVREKISLAPARATP